MTSQQPVIVIGMHRSGTTMLTKMLEELGVFLGWKKQGDHESTFFLSLKRWRGIFAGRPRALGSAHLRSGHGSDVRRVECHARAPVCLLL